MLHQKLLHLLPVTMPTPNHYPTHLSLTLSTIYNKQHIQKEITTNPEVQNRRFYLLGEKMSSMTSLSQFPSKARFKFGIALEFNFQTNKSQQSEDTSQGLYIPSRPTPNYTALCQKMNIYTVLAARRTEQDSILTTYPTFSFISLQNKMNLGSRNAWVR